MSLAKKPVIGVFCQIRHKPAFVATECTCTFLRVSMQPSCMLETIMLNNVGVITQRSHFKPPETVQTILHYSEHVTEGHHGILNWLNSQNCNYISNPITTDCAKYFS